VVIGLILWLRDPEFSVFSIQGKIISDSMTTFGFAVLSLFMYIGFLLSAGGIIALNSQRYFSNTELQKLLLYLVSIIPPVIVSRILVKQFILETVFIITVYLILSFTVNMFVKKRFSMKIWELLKSNKLKYFFVDLLDEIVLFALILGLVTKIIPRVFFVRFLRFDLNFTSGLYARLFFVVIFNCINYLSVEYIISIFNREIKKSYIKNYFLYNNTTVVRLLYVIKTSLPMILKKLKIFLSWFVSFIILFEMDNNIYKSIGDRIGLQSDGRPLNGNNIFPVFIVIYLLLFCINTLFDVIINNNEKQKNYQKEQKKYFWGKDNFLQTIGIIFLTSFSNKKKMIYIGIGFIGIFALALYYAPFYFFLQHYGYDTSQKFTINNVVDAAGMNTDVDDGQLLESPLCIKEVRGFLVFYSLAEFSIIKWDFDREEEIAMKVIPTMHTNVYNPDNLEPEIRVIIEDTIAEKDYLNQSTLVSIDYVHKIAVPCFIKLYIPFALERNGTGQPPEPISPNKLFFPVLVYYLFYLCLLVAVVYLVVIIIYMLVLHSRKNQVISAIGTWVKNLIFATPFVIVLAFLSTFFPFGNRFSGLHVLAAFIINSNSLFLNSIIAYCCWTIILLCYLVPGMISDISNFINEVMYSEEINYQNNIGMKKQDIFNIITKKYGISVIMRIFIENFLFMCVLQFFTMYCLSLSPFIDYFGISSVLSFENIFTKIMRATTVFDGAALRHYGLLLVMFGSVYFLMKRGKK
jgi:hypothetical protein